MIFQFLHWIFGHLSNQLGIAFVKMSAFALTMDAVTFAATALSLIANLQNTFLLSRGAVSDLHLDNAFGEVEILLPLLSESVAAIQSMPSPPPRSAWVALERCTGLEQELTRTLEKIGVTGIASSAHSKRRFSKHIRRAIYGDRVRIASSTFKSAVVLLHRIASQYVRTFLSIGISE